MQLWSRIALGFGGLGEVAVVVVPQGDFLRGIAVAPEFAGGVGLPDLAAEVVEGEALLQGDVVVGRGETAAVGAPGADLSEVAEGVEAVAGDGADDAEGGVGDLRADAADGAVAARRGRAAFHSFVVTLGLPAAQRLSGSALDVRQGVRRVGDLGSGGLLQRGQKQGKMEQGKKVAVVIHKRSRPRQRRGAGAVSCVGEGRFIHMSLFGFGADPVI